MTDDELLVHLRKIIREEVTAESKLLRITLEKRLGELDNRLEAIEDRLKDVVIDTSNILTQVQKPPLLRQRVGYV